MYESEKSPLRWSKLRSRLLAGKNRINESDFEEMTRRIEQNCRPASSYPNHRVLLVSSNGAGLGHLTRLAAISRFLNGPSLIYTLSSAYHVLGKSSKEIVYFPSYGDLGLNGAVWNPLLKAHLSAVVKGYKPELIVFDGTYVYRGVTAAARQAGVPLIWLQRGCWRREVLRKSAQRQRPAEYVDGVVVPRDYGCVEAEPSHQGEIETHYVNPVTLLGRSELLERNEARRQLGLPRDKRLFLVQLGAGVVNDTNQLKSAAISSVRELGEQWEPVLVANPLKKDFELQHHDVLKFSAYPVLKYLKAFDAAILAAGYNSVQESVVSELPAIFVPNPQTKTDDQVHRAKGMAQGGLGMIATTVEEVSSAVLEMGQSGIRDAITQRLRDTGVSNGAEEFEEKLRNFGFKGVNNGKGI